MAKLETRALRKQFGPVAAVDGIDLAIEDGELLVLLGPSGCGKTTLMRMIAGLESPTSGEIYIGGRRVDDSVPPRERGVAMVFQSYALYPHKTAHANIAFPLQARRTPKETIAQRVRGAARMFGLEGLLSRRPRQLSGGERQRVALARSVVRDPEVFLLDEPLSNLDAKLRASARDELKLFQRQIATTTIYVTHDQIEAMGLGDRIAVMHAGKVRQVGTPQEVYDDPADTFVATFLGSPPMNLIPWKGGLLLGFRPEHLLPEAFLPGDPAPKAAEATRIEPGRARADGIRLFPFRLRRVEYLGADRLLYGVIDGVTPETRVISRLPVSMRPALVEGDLYTFGVMAHALRAFDAETGMRRAYERP